MARKLLKNPIDDPPNASSSSSSSEEEEETSSEDEETQTPQIQKNPALNVKPIATKPMEETSKAKKSRSVPLASSVKASSAKRPREPKEETKEVKRQKKKAGEEGSGSAAVVEEVKKTGEDEKKQLFQRLFSEEDEIAVLKGMIDYLAKKGVDPLADTNAFYDLVKKSIHTDVSKAQLLYKIRRLRKKFLNNVGKGKNGEDRNFSKAHEQKSFELSKKIWGKEVIPGKVESSAAKSNGKDNGNGKPLAEFESELLSLPIKKMDGGELKSSKIWDSFFEKSFGVGGLKDEVLKHGLDMIGGEKRAALEEKLRKLQVAELELFLKQNELIRKQTKLILEFYKSEDV